MSTEYTKIKIDTLHIISRELIDREIFHIFKEKRIFVVKEEGKFYYLKSPKYANGNFLN